MSEMQLPSSLAAAAGSGAMSTGGEQFASDDMFKMTEVLPRRAKIAEMEKDKKPREVMVSLEAKAQKIWKRKGQSVLCGGMNW